MVLSLSRLENICILYEEHALQMFSTCFLDVPDETSLAPHLAHRFDGLKTTLKLDLIKGGSHDWTVADVGLLLPRLISESGALQSAYASAVRTRPPTSQQPWNLIVAWDEFAPGNKLAIDNSRKCLVVSIAFQELGQDLINNGLAWCTPAVIRTQTIKAVAGGMSNVLRTFLVHLMLGPAGLSTSGIPLEIGGCIVPLFAKVGNLMSDGDGIRAGFDWRGHASIKPCLKHFNVLKKDRALTSQ